MKHIHRYMVQDTAWRVHLTDHDLYAKDTNARLNAVLQLALKAVKVDGSLLALLQDVRKLRVKQ